MTAHTYGLDPHDLLLAAIVRQAIADLKSSRAGERDEARAYLGQLGLLDDAGNVVRAAIADVRTVWVGTFALSDTRRATMKSGLKGVVTEAHRTETGGVYAKMTVVEEIAGSKQSRDYACLVHPSEFYNVPSQAAKEQAVIDALKAERDRVLASEEALQAMGLQLAGRTVEL